MPACDDEFRRIREGALLSKVGPKNTSGTMILCAIDLVLSDCAANGDLLHPQEDQELDRARVEVPETEELMAVLERLHIRQVHGETIIHNLKAKNSVNRHRNS